jgi:DNA-directed RNA polymerase specialized sigma24 family protein
MHTGRNTEVHIGEVLADILDLGTALVVARVRLNTHLKGLIEDGDQARRILHNTLKRAWDARDEFTQDRAVDDWLLHILKRQVLN